MSKGVEIASADQWARIQELQAKVHQRDVGWIEMKIQASDFLMKAGSFAVATFFLIVALASGISFFIVVIRGAWYCTV